MAGVCRFYYPASDRVAAPFCADSWKVEHLARAKAGAFLCAKSCVLCYPASDRDPGPFCVQKVKHLALAQAGAFLPLRGHLRAEELGPFSGVAPLLRGHRRAPSTGVRPGCDRLPSRQARALSAIVWARSGPFSPRFRRVPARTSSGFLHRSKDADHGELFQHSKKCTDSRFWRHCGSRLKIWT